MDTKLSTNCKFKRVFASILSVVAVLAIAFVNVGFSAQAAGKASVSGWDGSAVLKPSVLHEASGYRMWYDGVDFYGNTQIGLAKSKDGATWTKFPNNPVLAGDPGA